MPGAGFPEGSARRAARPCCRDAGGTDRKRRAGQALRLSGRRFYPRIYSLECFRSGEQERRGSLAVPRQILVAEIAPAVIEADVHAVLEFEAVAAAETAKRVSPAEFLRAPRPARRRSIPRFRGGGRFSAAVRSGFPPVFCRGSAPRSNRACVPYRPFWRTCATRGFRPWRRRRGRRPARLLSRVSGRSRRSA